MRATTRWLPRSATTAAEVGLADWATYLEHLRRLGLPEHLLAGVDPDAFRVLAARLDGTVVATALGFDHEGDPAIDSDGRARLRLARLPGPGTIPRVHT